MGKLAVIAHHSTGLQLDRLDSKAQKNHIVQSTSLVPEVRMKQDSHNKNPKTGECGKALQVQVRECRRFARGN